MCHEESRTKFLDAVQKERDYQIQEWGNDFDLKNTLNDWAMYICGYATMTARGQRKPFEGLVKVAALACAAYEAFEANDEEFAPRHYDHLENSGRKSNE